MRRRPLLRLSPSGSAFAEPDSVRALSPSHANHITSPLTAPGTAPVTASFPDGGDRDFGGSCLSYGGANSLPQLFFFLQRRLGADDTVDVASLHRLGSVRDLHELEGVRGAGGTILSLPTSPVSARSAPFTATSPNLLRSLGGGPALLHLAELGLFGVAAGGAGGAPGAGGGDVGGERDVEANLLQSRPPSTRPLTRSSSGSVGGGTVGYNGFRGTLLGDVAALAAWTAARVSHGGGTWTATPAAQCHRRERAGTETHDSRRH